jgi:hypothetical protein
MAGFLRRCYVKFGTKILYQICTKPKIIHLMPCEFQEFPTHSSLTPEHCATNQYTLGFLPPPLLCFLRHVVSKAILQVIVCKGTNIPKALFGVTYLFTVKLPLGCIGFPLWYAHVK